MNLTWQIMRKDLRRLRLRLAQWVAVLAMKTAFGFLLLAGDGPGALAERATGISMVLVGLDVALGFLLAVALVQEDPLVGTQAFWMTRPVGGGRLLRAKLLLGLAIFGTLPVLAWLPWWLHCGYGPRELGWAAAETVVWQTLVVLPAVLLAVLTDGLSRVLLWLMALVAAVPTSLLLLTGQTAAKEEPSLMVSRGILALVVVMVAVAVTAVWQYRTRRRWAGLGIFLGGFAAAAVVATCGRWDLFPAEARQEFRDDGLAEVAGVRAECAGMTAVATTKKDREADRQWARVTLRVSGVPELIMAPGSLVRHQWTWAGGGSVDAKGWAWSTTGVSRRLLGLAAPRRDAETERYLAERRAARGLPPLAARPELGEGVSEIEASAQISPSVAARLAREPADYRARVQFRLLRPEIVYDEPLASGRWQAAKGVGFRLAQVERRRDGAELRRVVVTPALGDTMFYFGSRRQIVEQMLAGTMDYVLNRAEGDELIPRWTTLAEGQPVRLGTVWVRWERCFVDVPRVVRQGKWVPREGDWLAGARLLGLTAEPLGWFTREVEAKGVTMAPAEKAK